ncbi:MAG: GntR family transcriptional regulator [Candidatus Omnitrophota bacterium]
MRLKVDHKSNIPLHIQVEELLRDMIAKKEYQNGKLFPPEEEIAKLLGISRNTVRHATQRLVQEGLLQRKKGVGTKAVSNRMSTSLSAWDSFTHEMEQKGTKFETLKLQVEWIASDSETSANFHIKPLSKVLCLKRLKGFKNEPVVLFVSYFHPRVAIDENADFTRPLYEMLESDYSTVAVYSNEEISAIPAAPELAKILDVAAGSPVLVRKRLVSDPGRRPIEYNLCYYRADRFVYTIEIQRMSYK